MTLIHFSSEQTTGFGCFVHRQKRIMCVLMNCSHMELQEGLLVQKAAEDLHFQQPISGCILNHPTSQLGPRNPWEIWEESHLLLFRAAEWKSSDQRGRRKDDLIGRCFCSCLWAARRDSSSANEQRDEVCCETCGRLRADRWAELNKEGKRRQDNKRGTPPPPPPAAAGLT